jgi:hypothetical protein
MSEQSKDAGRRKWELVNRRNPEAIEELFRSDTVSHQPDVDLRGLEEAKAYLSMFVIFASVVGMGGDTALRRKHALLEEMMHAVRR